MTPVNNFGGSSCTCPRSGGGANLADVVVVGVVLGGHQQQDESLSELDPVQRHHTHVEENPKQHCQRYLTQNLPDHDGQTWEGGGRSVVEIVEKVAVIVVVVL